MLIGVATMRPKESEETITSWQKLCWLCTPREVIDNSQENIGVVAAYQLIYQKAKGIVAYIHDDVEIFEYGWDKRVLTEFEDPSVGVVGFGGALVHGGPALYRRPYHISQLGRSLYMSNTKDAEDHGERFTGVRDVAVLDGFCLIVRKELLDKCDGWDPENWPSHHVYDYRICAEAHRHGYRCRVVGIKCQHRGGETAVSAKYQEWATSTKWGSDAEMHAAGHRLFYDRYRDVMPWRCE